MTLKQKARIDGMNEEELRKTISNNFKNKEVVCYCEKRLDRLNVESAMIETSDPDDMEGLN